MAGFFVSRGYKRSFVSRHLVKLVRIAAQFKFTIFDKRSPEYAAFAAKNRIDDEGYGDGSGLFAAMWDKDGQMQFYISIDPTTEDPSFEDTFFEEVLHARTEYFRLKKSMADGPRVPRLFYNENKGISQMVDEFVAKEMLRVWGKGLPGDRIADLAVLMSYSSRATKDAEDFARLIQSIAGCSLRTQIPWREMSLYRYLRCMLKITDKTEFDNLLKSADEEMILDIIRPVYQANQKLPRTR